MDLHPIQGARASREEIEAIEAALGAGRSRDLLLPGLHAAQRRMGWVSPGALAYLSERLHLPPAETYGVVSFYHLFALEPRPAAVVHVCDDIACRALGADALKRRLESEIAKESWLPSPCLGLCEQAPAAMLTVSGEQPFERGVGNCDLPAIVAMLRDRTVADPPPASIRQQRSELRLLSRIGVIDPASFDDYRAHGGYHALRRAFEIGAANVIREVTDSNLVGRGGAAFPTGRKWGAVAVQPARPHYLVCNADESEPGTFKDRVLMEEDPYALVEAMTIAGWATGCERGYIYLRGEYPLANERLQHAIDEARTRGFLGAKIMGRDDASFEIEIRRGAGAYICGEETALFNSLEGFRGEPRNKPPFPVESGLFKKPTVINNVETLVNVLPILTHGGASFVDTKLFCLSGHVKHPGLYEIVLGTKLSELIAMAGGVSTGRPIKTVLLGGAAGTFLSPAELEVPLTFADTRKIGATLGSGVVLVLDDSTDLLGTLRRMAEFFKDESCGQCVPCRVGTIRVEELLERIEKQAPLGSWSSERQLLKELGQAMRDASICGLGQTATSAVESAIAKLNVIPG